MVHSSIDLSQGYYQAKMSKDTREVLAYAALGGYFRMKRLPMDMKISLGSFSRIICIALAGFTHNHCVVYPNNIFILSRMFEKQN